MIAAQRYLKRFVPCATSYRESGTPLAPTWPPCATAAILTNVLNPAREAHPRYLNDVLNMVDGCTLTRMIDAETATSVTLRREENKGDTVLWVDMEQLRSTSVSLIPEDLEQKMDQQAMGI